MKPTTIAFITSRPEPEFDWFTDSLEREVKRALGGKWAGVEVIVVDFYRPQRSRLVRTPGKTQHVSPKPTVWQGEGRLTKDHWWATANARNTALCLCSTEWIAFLDDRCVIQPGWLDRIKAAQEGKYVVAGSYEKRRGMTAISGVIAHGGIITGEDGRAAYQAKEGIANPMKCGGEWLFGCNFSLPLEWALAVNGVDESCDGLGAEDTVFGCHIHNAGYPIKFDSKMKMIEDRIPSAVNHAPMKHKDKGVSPNDKSHAQVKWLTPLKRAQHGFEIRTVRANALNGAGFPPAWGPKVDWYDQEPLGEMTAP